MRRDRDLGGWTRRFALLRGIAFVMTFLTCAPALARESDDEAPQRLTLPEAVAMALRQNPKLGAARENAESVGDQADSQRGKLLPVIRGVVNYSHVHSQQASSIGGILGGDGSSGGSSPPPSQLNFWGGYASLGAQQPILGLTHLSEDWLAQVDSARASTADVRADEMDLRLGVEEGFLALFEARALGQIATASLDDLGQQLTITEANVKNGTMTQADLLRVKTAVANAQQQQIQAAVQEQVARAQLLTTIGLPATNRAVEFIEPDAYDGRAVPSEEDALRLAHENRPELRAAQFNLNAADHRKLARWFNLLPEAGLGFTWYRMLNIPSFPSDIYVFGMSASWNIWEWGADYYQAKSAGALAESARLQLASEQDTVIQEVETRLSQERAAANAVQVAQAAIDSAVEAYRVTQVTVNAGAATTTDLLDAQSALTQARLNLVRARYQEWRARAELTRAIGG
jgi:OMF family outer membrane factor